MNEERKKRRLVLDLDEHTFAYLEMLAFGLNIEWGGKAEDGFDKSKNDFAPFVRKLLVDVSNSIATGVSRPGSWERGVVDSLTGWEGTYNRGMLSDIIKDEV